MKVKLIPWIDFMQMCSDKADYISCEDGYYRVCFEGTEYIILEEMKRLFGTTIEIQEIIYPINITKPVYTHKGHGFYWHKLYFCENEGKEKQENVVNFDDFKEIQEMKKRQRSIKRLLDYADKLHW